MSSGVSPPGSPLRPPSAGDVQPAGSVPQPSQIHTLPSSPLPRSDTPPAEGVGLTGSMHAERPDPLTASPHEIGGGGGEVGNEAVDGLLGGDGVLGFDDLYGSPSFLHPSAGLPPPAGDHAGVSTSGPQSTYTSKKLDQRGIGFKEIQTLAEGEYELAVVKKDGSKEEKYNLTVSGLLEKDPYRLAVNQNRAVKIQQEVIDLVKEAEFYNDNGLRNIPVTSLFSHGEKIKNETWLRNNMQIELYTNEDGYTSCLISFRHPVQGTFIGQSKYELSNFFGENKVCQDRLKEKSSKIIKTYEKIVYHLDHEEEKKFADGLIQNFVDKQDNQINIGKSISRNEMVKSIRQTVRNLKPTTNPISPLNSVETFHVEENHL